MILQSKVLITFWSTSSFPLQIRTIELSKVFGEDRERSSWILTFLWNLDYHFVTASASEFTLLSAKDNLSEIATISHSHKRNWLQCICIKNPVFVIYSNQQCPTSNNVQRCQKFNKQGQKLVSNDSDWLNLINSACGRFFFYNFWCTTSSLAQPYQLS